MHDIITHEQLCAMIKRYMDYKNIVIETSSAEMQFTDENSISAYAAEYVHKLQKYGIIAGCSTDEGASRAECAAVITIFMTAAGIL